MSRTRTASSFLALLLAAASAFGCSQIRTEYGTSMQADVGPLAVSETSWSDALAAYGPPRIVSALPTGMAFLYDHVVVHEDQIGLNYDDEDIPVFLTWVKASYGTAHLHREAMVLVFDREGLLESYAVSRGRESLGSGAALQILIDVASVIDSGYLAAGTDPNLWGRSLLASLPPGLNRAQSVDQGQYGLEQRGTPTGAGARTLELRDGPPEEPGFNFFERIFD